MKGSCGSDGSGSFPNPKKAGLYFPSHRSASFSSPKRDAFPRTIRSASSTFSSTVRGGKRVNKAWIFSCRVRGGPPAAEAAPVQRAKTSRIKDLWRIDLLPQTVMSPSKRVGYWQPETTVNFAFLFVQNNSGGTDAGYWKWQNLQTTPGQCWRQILKRASLAAPSATGPLIPHVHFQRTIGVAAQPAGRREKHTI